MFDFIRSNTRVLFFILLVLIIPSFIFLGVDGYRRLDEGGNVAVAKVDGAKISQAEWDFAHRQQSDRIRAQQPDMDPKRLDSPEARLQTLDDLVRQRVILAAVDKLHLVTLDERLKRLFTADPQFASIRNPDGSANKDLLAAQGMSTDMFAQRLRQDLSAQQVLRGITASVVAPMSVAKAAIDPLFQQREVQILSFPAQKQLASIKPSDAEIEAFYRDPSHAARFKAPEQADVEYVVLDVEAMKKSVAVNEDELKKYYEQNTARFTTPEERRASHVLVKAGKEVSADERAKARAKAEGLLAEIRAKPANFSEIARKNSDDPGSAQRGGDLDFFGRGQMTKPFEEAAFALKKVGDVTGLVESDFGFHIIQLTGLRGGEKRSFESVRAELEDESRAEQAQKKFSEAAVDFSNTVYEQADSLKPVADKFKLEIQSAKAVAREARADAGNSPLANPRFLELLFADDSVRNKRNTEAVDLGRSRLVAGRIVKHTPARLLPLDEVRDSVRQALALQQAAAAARKEGEARLTALKEAPQTALTEPVVKLSRLQSRGEVPPALLDAALRAPTAALPGFVGVDLGDQGYAVVKLISVLPMDPALADPARGQAQYGQAWADAEARAYYAALKKRFKVDITSRAAAVAAANALN
jgi:peptidyl-prolyl cis-trans isomerase D